ncbi:MAG: cat1, partial [Firmicutes bacterium]|nr:cat1 [Bacillota bacterium]
MDWKAMYQKKLISVEDAAAVIQSNDRVWYPPCSGAPVDLVNAISKRYKELENVTMISALI